MIKYNRVKKMKLSEFTHKNNLTLNILLENGNYHITLELCAIKRGALLQIVRGQGANIKLAIRDFRGKISEKHLVYNPYSEDRRDIYVPKMG